jgi:phage-related protein
LVQALKQQGGFFMSVELIVEFVELDKGKKPFAEFLASLSEEEAVKILARIDFFVLHKSSRQVVTQKLSRLLRDGIFEIKCELNVKTARVLYFYVKGAKMVITHGFIKKGKKTDPKEIERAIKLRMVYEQRGLK